MQGHGSAPARLDNQHPLNAFILMYKLQVTSLLVDIVSTNEAQVPAISYPADVMARRLLNEIRQ